MADLYVHSSGSALNDGSRGAPLPSVEEAIYRHAVAGDRVILTGEERPSVVLDQAKSFAEPVTLSADSGCRFSSVRLVGVEGIVGRMARGAGVDGGVEFGAVEKYRQPTRFCKRVGWFGGDCRGFLLKQGTSDYWLQGVDVTEHSNGVIHTAGITYENGVKVPAPPSRRGRIWTCRFLNGFPVAVNARVFEDLDVFGNRVDGIRRLDDRHPDCLRTLGGGKRIAFRWNLLGVNEAQGIFVKDGYVDDLLIEYNLIEECMGASVGINLYGCRGIVRRNALLRDAIIVNSGASIYSEANNVSTRNNGGTLLTEAPVIAPPEPPVLSLAA